MNADWLYRPQGAAKQLFPCRAPAVLIEGPAGTGKTRAVLEKLSRWCMKAPGCRVLIVRKTRASMTESVLVTLESKVIPPNPELYPDLHAQGRRTRQSYQYPNGSCIVVGGMDNPDRIMSTEYDMIGVFEATELVDDDFEKLTSRLRNGRLPFHQIICDCNPAAPSHWLNQKANQGQLVRILSRHEDNPALYDNGQLTKLGRDYLATLDRLTGARKLRLKQGVWAASEGLVYDEFDPAIHLVSKFVVPETWRKIRAIDFGFTHAFVCLWLAYDGDGRIFVYRQYVKSKGLVQDHAAEIIRLTGSEKIEATVADPEDAEGRATLAKYGVQTIQANKAVKAGIEAVKIRLRVAGDGRPRLMVMRDSLVARDAELMNAKMPTCIEEEFDSYVWDQSKDQPIKEQDDALDALRYGVMYRTISRVASPVIFG